jgi:hypothetical protein
MKIMTSFYLFILILIIALIVSFINPSIIIFGLFAYSAFFQILLSGFYGESLRTGKVHLLVGFVFFTVIWAWFQWTFFIFLFYKLSFRDGILYEAPMAVLFVLSILLAFRVRSKNKRITSDKVST